MAGCERQTARSRALVGLAARGDTPRERRMVHLPEDRGRAAGRDANQTCTVKQPAAELRTFLVPDVRGYTAFEGAYSVTFDPTGPRMVTAREEQGADIWDVDGFERLAALVGARDVGEVAFSPDGSLIATAHEDGTVR